MEFATITLQNNELLLRGNWLVDQLDTIDSWIQSQLSKNTPISTINATGITQIDTAGAMLLYMLRQKAQKNNPTIAFSGLSQSAESLLKLVSEKIETIAKTPVKKTRHGFLYTLGLKSVNSFKQSLSLFGFLGEVIVLMISTVINPVKLQMRSMMYEIESGGYRALPIIAVMMFLIGVVIAYQLGVQLRIYGANVYMVDLSGVAILREFSPLICSVIIAGRTSTSFAALIGTMKVNEEIDALKTMGLSPIERLVLPKILGLLVALPLLVVWGDVFGLLGSMVMAKSMAGISFPSFLQRFKQEVAIKHLYIGLVKTPIFAMIIAGIGCYQGFQAEGSAQSVGLRTTKAAVQAIFLIILADGIFSIIFNFMDI